VSCADSFPVYTDSMKHRVCCIIPAYNEERTVEAVVRVALAHPLVDEVVVVCDGCTDRTADIAAALGARVLSLPYNQGKGEAVARGVKETSGDILLFLDADIIGLTEGMITSMLQPVLNGNYGMVTLRRDRWYSGFTYPLGSIMVVGGERALTRALYKAVPANRRQGYWLELALNRYSKILGLRSNFVFAPGLHILSSERRYGFLEGMARRLNMNRQVAAAAWIFYVWPRS
jgi:glycosyltransferase involved in cell wall biosynthesis